MTAAVRASRKAEKLLANSQRSRHSAVCHSQLGTSAMTTRRDVFSKLATLGMSGAALTALSHMADAKPSAMKSLYGRGKALEGPYLDMRTGAGNKLGYARIQGDLNFGKPKFFWFKGYGMAIEPNKKIENLMGTAGFGVIRLAPGPNGSIRRMCREVIIYTDLKTGEVLDQWKNPLTNETVKVVHVANDPFNYVIEDHFPQPPKFGNLNQEAPPKIPFILPWYQHGDQIAMEIHIHLLYPNALRPDKWVRESAGPMVQASEFFAHHLKAADLQNPKLTTVDYQGVWNRITPWLPWMLMGQRPGMMQYACFMGTTKNLEEVLDKRLLDYCEKHYKKYFDAPTEWTEDRSLSSLENYAREQTPVPPKP
jgi:Protein of unknown function (DUF1838)